MPPTDGPPSDPDSHSDPDKTVTLRVLDVAANRAAEGLRVVEDFARFGLDDRHLTDLCKTLRHDLKAALSDIPTLARLKARDTEADVGTDLTHESETRRNSARDVCAAALKRTQQSLRSLEEFSKIISDSVPERFESIRYRCYSLERCLEINHNSRDQLAKAQLYVLVEGQPSVEEFTNLVQEIIQGGADIIQLRDKNLNDRLLVERARLLKKLTHDTKTRAIINDRPDIAAISGADGVHVGQEELSVKDARKIVGCDQLVGVSTHNLDQVRQAVLDGADYLGVGPTFPSETKSFDSFPGLDFLREATAETTLPTFAIGGITHENLDQVLATGIRRVAVGSAVVNSESPQRATSLLSEKLRSAPNIPNPSKISH